MNHLATLSCSTSNIRSYYNIYLLDSLFMKVLLQLEIAMSSQQLLLTVSFPFFKLRNILFKN